MTEKEFSDAVRNLGGEVSIVFVYLPPYKRVGRFHVDGKVSIGGGEPLKLEQALDVLSAMAAAL